MEDAPLVALEAMYQDSVLMNTWWLVLFLKKKKKKKKKLSHMLVGPMISCHINLVITYN